MHLTIIDPESNQEIGKFQADTWLEAVQHIERNKSTYLEKELTKVNILNKRSDAIVYWSLTPDPRPILLNDKPFVESPSTIKSR